MQEHSLLRTVPLLLILCIRIRSNHFYGVQLTRILTLLKVWRQTFCRYSRHVIFPTLNRMGDKQSVKYTVVQARPFFLFLFILFSTKIIKKKGIMGNLSYDMTKVLVDLMMNLFFREISVQGSHLVPKEGPIIFVVAPHANQVKTKKSRKI